MNNSTERVYRPVRYTVAIAIVYLILVSPPGAKVAAPSSGPGIYEGYSEPVFNQWQRSSQYVKVRDGIELAVDIFRPAIDGEPVKDPLPVIWTYDRYHRADLKAGNVVTQLDQDAWLQTVVRHGYVIGVVDVRGGGASFGTWKGLPAKEEATDVYDITNWFAGQKWCNGRVGMFGRSYLGVTQLMGASTAPPSLKAIFPEMAVFDLYDFVCPGGIFRDDYASNWTRLINTLDSSNRIAPVDEDKDGQLVARAINDHKANRNPFEMFSKLSFRDSRDAKSNSKPYADQTPNAFLNRINASGVGVYLLAGWNDLFAKDMLAFFNNLKVPHKIIIGPWHHTDYSEFNLAAEHLRWYDYWLKDIDNGILNEPSIYYYTMGAPEGKQWSAAHKWPLPEQQEVKYYFESGPSGSIKSVNDGSLASKQPAAATGGDQYTVDYTTTSGKTTRWASAYGGQFGYPNMASNDAKALTYTTPPLESDTQITGHPLVSLWVSSTAKDGDFFVYLEEVLASGYSRYITEGALRASHRALSKPPFDYINLPYHRSFAEDVAELPNEPVELSLDLMPTSVLLRARSRIRVTVTCKDKDNALSPEVTPPPTVTVYRNAKNSSYITLPIIPLSRDGAASVDQPGAEMNFISQQQGIWIGIAAFAIGAMALLTYIKVRHRKVI